MNNETALVDKVKAGAAWLDENYPGWHERINTFDLNMADGNLCILGQVGRKMLTKDDIETHLAGFSWYVKLLERHDLLWEFPADHGFCWAPDHSEPFVEEAYQVWMRQGTLLWIAEVNSRVASGLVAHGS